MSGSPLSGGTSLQVLLPVDALALLGNTQTAKYNLCIPQNASYTIAITWSQNITVQGIPQLLPVNLTGYTAALKIRAYPLAPTVLFDCSPYITLGGVAGTITLALPASVTAGFTWWNGVYDLLLTDSLGNVTRLLQGTVTVSPGVS